MTAHDRYTGNRERKSHVIKGRCWCTRLGCKYSRVWKSGWPSHNPAALRQSACLYSSCCSLVALGSAAAAQRAPWSHGPQHGLHCLVYRATVAASTQDVKRLLLLLLPAYAAHSLCLLQCALQRYAQQPPCTPLAAIIQLHSRPLSWRLLCCWCCCCWIIQ